MTKSEGSERRLGLALMACVVLVYIPFAGDHGLWDPWETHYGEVARQMAERGDVVTLHYPASPLERDLFFSKPVLLFWLTAPLLKLLGVVQGGLTMSWRAEWAMRFPSLLLGLLTIAMLFAVVRRMASPRAALLGAVILATCPSWLLLSRQAMTDMPFVAPMVIALLLVARNLFAPSSVQATKLARSIVGLSALVPLALVTWQAHRAPMVVPWISGVAGLVFVLRARTQRALELHAAWMLCGVATLAKGPAGLALPMIGIGLHLVLERRPRAIFTELELVPGLLLFIAVALPWYEAMLLRHGAPFLRELIGDNYVNRATGRHGDRGTFEYYAEWCGYGLFPWTGLAALGLVRALRERAIDARGKLQRLASLWVLVVFAVLTLVNTKFHHYLLPMVPGLALVTGLYLDELLDDPRRHRLAVVLVALPLTLLCGLDLALQPQRLHWLFDYDYVNVPLVGRAWPTGDDYDYRLVLSIFALVAGLGILALRRSIDRPRVVYALWLVPLVLVLACLAGPSVHAPKPTLWLVPLVLALPWFVWLVRRTGLGLLLAVALAFDFFIADRVIIELSPHWSQKHVIASYYAQRRSADEPLLVWELFWRGENFYTANAIYRSSDPTQRTVFLGSEATTQLTKWIAAHPGQRVFFLVERAKLEGLRRVVPATVRDSMRIADESNNKLYLVATHT